MWLHTPIHQGGCGLQHWCDGIYMYLAMLRACIVNTLCSGIGCARIYVVRPGV